MHDTRDSARQLATCRAILLRAHSRVRVYLWRRWEFRHPAGDAQLMTWTLTTLWNAMLQFPNQALLASYLKQDGRRFCQDALSESLTSLRFLRVAGVVVVALAGLAITLDVLNLAQGLTPILWVVVIVGVPLWLVFFLLEVVEYRSARYLSAAIETAIERLEAS